MILHLYHTLHWLDVHFNKKKQSEASIDFVLEINKKKTQHRNSSIRSSWMHLTALFTAVISIDIKIGHESRKCLDTPVHLELLGWSEVQND